jgi:hypothetical protein
MREQQKAGPFLAGCRCWIAAASDQMHGVVFPTLAVRPRDPGQLPAHPVKIQSVSGVKTISISSG